MGVNGGARLTWTLISAATAAGVAEAQAETERPRGVIEEIVVTAQKRAENLQDTPIAITALTADAIEQSGIASVQQLQLTVPSMSFGEQVGYNFVTIRGVGSDLTGTAGEPSVGVYVDGVYQTQIAQNVPNFDLERIEVLRGPQGTLYGRNTPGGVINFITKEPDFSPGAHIRMSYGNYDTAAIDAAVTGPLLQDRLAARLSAHFDERDGYRRNIARDERVDEARNKSARLSLLFTPTEQLSVTLRGDVSDNRGSPPYGLASQESLDGVTSQATPLGIFSLPAAALEAVGGILSPEDIARLNGGSIADYYGLSQPGPMTPDPTEVRKVSNFAPTRIETEARGGSVTVDWDVDSMTSFKSITAYRDTKLTSQIDTGGIATPTVFFNPQIHNSEQFTQELHVGGTALDGRLDWLVGAYYYREDADFGANLFLPTEGDSARALLALSNPPGSEYLFNLAPEALPGIADFVPPNILASATVRGPNYGGMGQLTPFVSVPDTAMIAYLTEQTSRSMAGFAQLTYSLTDRLRATGGFRYTRDEKDVERTFHSNLIYTLGTLFGFEPPLCHEAESERTWKEPTGTVGIEFDASENVLTYGKVSWGYKAGGANPGECSGVFDPEYLTAYEGGVKAVLAHGQVVTNVAAYYYDYTDIQFTTYVNNASAIQNAGSAKAFGVELEYSLRPDAAPGLRVDGSVSYQDSEYGDGYFQDVAGLIPPPGLNIEGNRLVRAPEWKLNIGSEYEVRLRSAGSLLIRGEATYTSKIHYDIFNGKAPSASATTQPSYWLVNASLAWTSSDERYLVQLFGNNLTNELYFVNRNAFNTPAGVMNVGGPLAPPRTYGVRFSMSMGSG